MALEKNLIQAIEQWMILQMAERRGHDSRLPGDQGGELHFGAQEWIEVLYEVAPKAINSILYLAGVHDRQADDEELSPVLARRVERYMIQQMGLKVSIAGGGTFTYTAQDWIEVLYEIAPDAVARMLQAGADLLILDEETVEDQLLRAKAAEPWEAAEPLEEVDHARLPGHDNPDLHD